MKSNTWLWVLALGSFAMVGCGNDRPQLVPVTGQVTLDGGSWPTSGALYFVPIEVAEGFPHRPGSAEFAADGHFAAKTFHSGDGLFPGRYRVRVECWITPPAMNVPGESHIPVKYQNPATSGLEVTVKPNGGHGVPVYNLAVFKEARHK